MLRLILTALACIAAALGCADSPPELRVGDGAAAQGADTSFSARRPEAGRAPEASTPDVIEVIDDAGHLVRLSAPARRILSLIPARTDVLLAMGVVDRLIARTRYDEDARLAHLASLGDALTPSVEWIAAERPDLVIAWPDAQSRDVVQRLIELGVPVYGSRVETLGDIDRAIRHLGRLLALETRADSISRAIRAEHDRVRAAVAGRDRPGVLYLIGLEPVMAAGPGTFVHELIDIAGGRNIFADVQALWPRVSLEEIVRRDPAVIVMASGDLAAGDLARRLAARAGWRNVTAVRTGRVYRVDPSVFNRPGPSVGEAAAELGRLLHPDVAVGGAP